MSATLKAESQKAKFSVCSESKPHQSDNLDNHQAQAEDELLAQLEAVASKVSNLNVEQEAGVQGAGLRRDTSASSVRRRSAFD
jgi:UDP-N-acetylglucosamine transferase subunit ALG13